MSRGNQLQEMEAGTKQSKTAVNSGAKPAEAMPKLTTGIAPGQTGSWEDLGGPTPENYKSDDDSSKLKEPSLKTVSDVVTRGAKGADSMQKLSGAVKEEEEVDDEDLLDEEQELEDDSESTEEIEEVEEEEEEEEEEIEESFDIEDDVNALLNAGDEADLSEEFKDKAKTIFESALRSKVAEIRETLEEEYESAYEQRLVETVESIKSELQERVDAYLEYVADEWISENQLSVQSGLKEELSESFMTGLKGLFEDHYVSIPEDKYDVLESMVEKLDDMETKLNEQIEKNISLNKRLSESVADGIFDEISEGLALSQKEKLASLAESVEFESESQYREKLETLKESYFPSKSTTQSAKSETLSEGVDVATEYHSDSMNAYLKALSVVAKN
jgi:hypothetical protein